MKGFILEEIKECVELTMPHDIFIDFSNQVRDGVLTQLIFKDALTGDIYSPEGLVKMTYFYGEEAVS